MERDLASGTEREVLSIPNPGVGGFGLSPDGRAVAFDATDSSGAESLFVMPIAGGTPRQVFAINTSGVGTGRPMAGRSLWRDVETANPASCGSWMSTTEARASST
jgi:hypothetical protein